ncbi:hypothetical protein BD770DRAFT_179271 [Pilaira anomala]|nr:hypothetical protein BD770DRAFT_179271 [Pilaira anomala]
MSEYSDYEQDFPEIDWEQVAEYAETTYDPNPMAKGWVLIHGPNISALNELKKKVTVNIPPHSNKRSIESVSEPIQTPKTKVMITSTEPQLDELAMEEMKGNQTITQIDWTDYRAGLDQLTPETTGTTTETTAETIENTETTRITRRVLPNTAQKSKVWQKYTKKIQEPIHSRRVLPDAYQTHNNAKPVSDSSTLEPIFEAKEQYDKLSQEQKEAHDAVVSEKHNVFITGSAGTGKSVLLRCKYIDATCIRL